MLHFVHERRNGFIDIHRRLVKVYEADAVDTSTGGNGSVALRAETEMSMTKWLRTSKRSPVPGSEVRPDELSRADRRISVNEMHAEFAVGVRTEEKSTFNSGLAFHSPLSADRHE